MAKNGVNKVQDGRADAMGERPWYEPEDLENKAIRLEQAMVESLTAKQKERLQHQSPEKMSSRFRNEVHKAVIMGMMDSVDYRIELARNSLRKPLEAAKLMGAFVEKTVQVQGEVRHHHAIVVPATLSNDAWNEGQKSLGDALEDGWAADSPWGNVQDAVIVKEGE